MEASQIKNLKLFKDFCQNSKNACDIDPAIHYMNYIIDRIEMNEEQVLWLCFLYAVTYQLPTAWVIWNEYPDLELADIPRLEKWWTKETQQRLPFQQDKMKQRKDFVKTVSSYQSIVGNSQKDYFDSLLSSDSPQINFERMWSPLKSISYFGRFSTWNWCQALKHVAGYNVEPTNLMLGESDSISFTDGLAYAFGYTDRVTKKFIDFQGKKKKEYYKWSVDEKLEMENACALLKKDMKLDNFQLETLACAFKKIWRKHDSRYVGYYNDRIAEDIRKTASYGWNGIDWKLLWDAREACVPKKYLHDNMGINHDIFLFPPEKKVYV